jgi:hypothetical protein
VTEPEDDTVRLDLAGLVDPDPTAYVERYRPPVPPPVRRRPIDGDDGRDETTPL